MKPLRKRIFITAGYNTISMGSGRKEFNPRSKDRPGLEHYLMEAGRGSLALVPQPDAIDEGVISNFLAARFCRQANLAGFLPAIHPALKYKPATRVEGACGSGGMALVTAIKTVLSDQAEAVLTVGVEVQNTVKAIYGADYLAAAGHYAGQRKQGHAYFFPAKFSERAGAYFKAHGQENTRKAMATWYAQMVENARRYPKAQEHHNSTTDLLVAGMTPPNADSFLENLNVFDCSKVSDGASSLVIASEEGLKRLGLKKSDAAEVKAFAQVEDDITQAPPDLAKLDTTQKAAERVYQIAGIGPKDLGMVEVHDCFTITAVLAFEALGLAERGKGGAWIISGASRPDGQIPANISGGLIGFGHYVGGTGIRQAVDCWQQLLGKSEGQTLKLKKPLALMVSMGGDDKTVSSLLFGSAS